MNCGHGPLTRAVRVELNGEPTVVQLCSRCIVQLEQFDEDERARVSVPRTDHPGPSGRMRFEGHAAACFVSYFANTQKD